LRRLRQQGNSLPVLIITAHRLSRRDVQDMQSSATSYIAKPFDPTWMLQTIQRTLQQHA
jgi:DNA-binding NtrC family response regulator